MTRCLLSKTIVLAVVFALCGCNQDDDSVRLAASLKGLNESEVIRTMGNPSATFSGHYGLRQEAFAAQYPNVRSHVFDMADGKIYVTIDLDTGDCISAHYLRDGEQF